MTTTERIATGLYRVYDENNYLLCAIRKAVRRTRPWIITYTGGNPGGSFPTLKAAKQAVDDRWENDE